MATLLLVDDQRDGACMLQELLQPHGFEVTVAGHGGEALELARIAPPDLVVSDILMPVMDGFALCRRWKSDAQLKRIPFVFYSATYTDPKDEEFALGLGAARFIIKPQSVQELARNLHEVLEAHRAGRLAPAAEPLLGEDAFYRNYNEALVRKLEDKIRQLETANQAAQREIAERKRAEEQLRMLSRAVEQSPASVVITDSEGRIEYVNQKFLEVTGYALEEVLRQNPRILKSGRTPAEHYRGLWETITAGREWWGEFQNRKKNGDLYWEWAVVSPIKDENGRITHFLAVKEDITERKRAEEIRARLEAQLRQAQKMEAFGQLAGGVAHDFNNILTVIKGHASLLRVENLSGADQSQSLAEIARAAERAASLTRQLLTFSRRQVLQPKTLDLNEVVADMTQMLQRLIGEHIALEAHYAAGDAPVFADPGMMEQVLVNLAVNARDAMPKGGQLLLRTRALRFTESEAASHPKARAGDFVCLSVTDTGCGITPEHLPQIFEPFFTTKEVGKGTGLGLATVFGIVEQHQGWIEVESEVGIGTRFHVYLPRATMPGAAPVQGSAAVNLRGGTETILIVEDEAAVRILVRRVLEHQGYRVLEASSGVNALQVWEAQGASVDLVLTDLVMPDGVSGRELGERLLAQRPTLKVVYSSGYSEEVLGDDFILRNSQHFLEKPYDLAKLTKTVRDCLDAK